MIKFLIANLIVSWLIGAFVRDIIGFITEDDD